jgi:hypothetical protein
MPPVPKSQRAAEWRATLAWLVKEGVDVDRPTSTRTLRDFEASTFWDPQRQEAISHPASPTHLSDTAMLVRHGISAADMVALCEEPVPREFTSVNLYGFLLDLAPLAPDMRLRDCVAWILAVTATRGSARAPEIAEVWTEWDAVGLGDGALFWRAGLGPEEARDGLAAGTLTEDGARLLVALRDDAPKP